MIREDELNEAILAYEGSLNPDAPTCRNLAALYTIRDHLFEDGATPRTRAYSGAAARTSRAAVLRNADQSEFMALASEIEPDALLDIMSDLMQAVEWMNPKLYRNTLRKLREHE